MSLSNLEYRTGWVEEEVKLALEAGSKQFVLDSDIEQICMVGGGLDWISVGGVTVKQLRRGKKHTFVTQETAARCHLLVK